MRFGHKFVPSQKNLTDNSVHFELVISNIIKKATLFTLKKVIAD